MNILKSTLDVVGDEAKKATKAATQQIKPTLENTAEQFGFKEAKSGTDPEKIKQTQDQNNKDLLDAMYGSSAPKDEGKKQIGLGAQLGLDVNRNTGSTAEQFGLTPNKNTASIASQLGAEANKNTAGIGAQVNVVESLEKPPEQAQKQSQAAQRQHAQTYGEQITGIGRMASLEAQKKPETEAREEEERKKQLTAKQRIEEEEEQERRKKEEEEQKKKKEEEEIKAAQKQNKIEKAPGAG